MEEKIKDIMSVVFQIDSSEIDENTTANTVEKWDSLKMIDLIIALEEEFDIVFEEDELDTLLSYNSILLCVKKKYTENKPITPNAQNKKGLS